MKEVINFECACVGSCGIVRITRFVEEGYPNEYFFVYYAPVYDIKYDGIFRTIWNRIKAAFHNLIGREYSLYEVVLLEEDWKKFKEEIKDF